MTEPLHWVKWWHRWSKTIAGTNLTTRWNFKSSRKQIKSGMHDRFNVSKVLEEEGRIGPETGFIELPLVPTDIVLWLLFRDFYLPGGGPFSGIEALVHRYAGSALPRVILALRQTWSDHKDSYSCQDTSVGCWVRCQPFSAFAEPEAPRVGSCSAERATSPCQEPWSSPGLLYHSLPSGMKEQSPRQKQV